ncbi:MAG: type II secretion system protein [Elusimicrobia bacterium]|nr:type II secretion system protein [Elusimicrobiota bacterium]
MNECRELCERPQPATSSPGYTLVEVLVAVMLAVNVLTGMLVGYTAILRYVINLQQQNTGSFAAFAALKLVVRELADVSCTLETECPDFDSIVYCNPSGDLTHYYVWGRRHADPNLHGDTYVRFDYDTSANDLTYCSNAGSMGGEGACAGSQVTVAKDLDNDLTATPAEVPFTCDSTNKQVTVILRSIEEKDAATGSARRTRRFESTVKIPFGCDTGC